MACTDWEVTEKFITKSYTYAIARAAGVPAPRTVTPASLEEAERLGRAMEYPCVVKPSESHRFYERFHAKLFLARDPDELLACCRRAFAAGMAVMLQEYIPGEDTLGVNYNSYVWEGRVVAEFTACKVRQAPPGSGVPCVVVSRRVPEVIEPGRAILAAMGFSGFACTEFKRDPRDGVYKLMEVNGRHNRSGLLAWKCGLSFPRLQYEHLMFGRLPREAPGFRGGGVLDRPVQGPLRERPPPAAAGLHARALAAALPRPEGVRHPRPPATCAPSCGRWAAWRGCSFAGRCSASITGLSPGGDLTGCGPGAAGGPAAAARLPPAPDMQYACGMARLIVHILLLIVLAVFISFNVSYRTSVNLFGLRQVDDVSVIVVILLSIVLGVLYSLFVYLSSAVLRARRGGCGRSSPGSGRRTGRSTNGRPASARSPGGRRAPPRPEPEPPPGPAGGPVRGAPRPEPAQGSASSRRPSIASPSKRKQPRKNLSGQQVREPEPVVRPHLAEGEAVQRAPEGQGLLRLDRLAAVAAGEEDRAVQRVAVA